MKQDVNFFLLGLLVLVLVAMVAMALYAQSEYHSLSGKYETALEDLKGKSQELENRIDEVGKTRTELESKEKALADIVSELNLSAERESSLGGFFEDLKGEKEELEEDLSKTVQEKENWRFKYTATEKDLQVCEEGVKLKETQLVKERAKSAQLIRDIKDVGSWVNKSRDQLNNIDELTEKINTDLSALYKKVGDYDEPDEISNDAKSEIKNGIDDIRSLADNKVADSIESLKGTLENIEKKIGGIE